MNDYFLGSIYQLIERGQLLLSKIPTDLPGEFHVLEHTCRSELARILDGLHSLVKDDNLPLCQPEHLRRLRRAVSDMNYLETVGIAALNRANRADQQLSALIRQIRTEIAYPRLPPVVTSLSLDYFHIYPYLNLNLLSVPLGEGDFLLHLPDLYHELAHPLIVEKYDPRIKPFQRSLLRALNEVSLYIADELLKEERRLSPAEFKFYLDRWEVNWYESWAIEFFCDLFAVYTIGPAYGWANLHLCAKRGGNPFYVPRVSLSTHPADNARTRVILYGLDLIGFVEEAKAIEARWKDLLAISEAKPEPEYRRCFPQHILLEFARNALEGAEAIGCRIARPGLDLPVYAILNQAWVEFWRDPVEYAAWEREAVEKLREFCDTK